RPEGPQGRTSRKDLKEGPQGRHPASPDLLSKLMRLKRNGSRDVAAPPAPAPVTTLEERATSAPGRAALRLRPSAQRRNRRGTAPHGGRSAPPFRTRNMESAAPGEKQPHGKALALLGSVPT